MESLSHYPLLVFAVAFVALWLASAAGSWLRRNYPNADDEQNEHLGVILAATLTLLALIIGFSFSMSINRYDQRKNFEEAEANAIGTELLRADFLPPADAANVRKLLGEYLDQRIQFYLNRTMSGECGSTTDQPVAGSSLVCGSRSVRCTTNAGMALALAGMNDVINSQGYTQAAYWNRIPAAAWYFMALIALCSSALLGYRSRSGNAAGKLVLVLPLVVSISFLLIADIDAPRHGLIEVRPQNLESLAKSLGR